MFDKIVYISDHSATIKLKDAENVVMNLMNLHIVFEDDTKKVLGEVDDLDKDLVKARFLGEIVNGRLIGGTIRKPSLDAKIRVITQEEVPMITGSDAEGWMKLGVSPFYNDFPVFLDVNNFFSNHFAIFGNSGSGKSCGISRLFQNMFQDQRLYPYKANILLFDSSGEYYNAFNNLSQINPNYNYRFISTNEVDGIGEKLRLPIYLLNADDLALLLQVTNHSQLPIIERMLKLALVFSQEDMDANAYKNHLIAKAIMSILYTNETSPNKRNEIFSILGSCSTPEFNLEAVVQGIGYTRKFRECFLIDNSGNFSESVLLTEYVTSFINEDFDNYEPHTGVFYTLDTLEKALNFTLISEGWLRNTNTYGDAVTIKVRLHSLIVGDNAKFFNVENYITLEEYLSSLLITDGRKYQIVNINLDDVDDDFAKVITKIYSRLIFQFAKALKNRASIPFHIVVEEAHRYIQNDTDRFLIGYNIFERIAKEGRKYGVILGLITQRPVEMSDTVISQCSNFLIFKMNHPVDVEYIRKMVPNISDEIVEKQKTLQSGTCLGFGMGFRIPLIVKMEMPNPSPLSSNCDVVNIWSGGDKPAGGFSSIPADVQNPVSNENKAIPQIGGEVDVAVPQTNIPELVDIEEPSISNYMDDVNKEKDAAFLIPNVVEEDKKEDVVVEEATPVVQTVSEVEAANNSGNKNNPESVPVDNTPSLDANGAIPEMTDMLNNTNPNNIATDSNGDTNNAEINTDISTDSATTINIADTVVNNTTADNTIVSSPTIDNTVDSLSISSTDSTGENTIDNENGLLSLSSEELAKNFTALNNQSQVSTTDSNASTSTAVPGEINLELDDDDDDGIDDNGPDFS